MFSQRNRMNRSLLTNPSNISKVNIPWHVNAGRIEWQTPCNNADLLTVGVPAADQVLVCHTDDDPPHSRQETQTSPGLCIGHIWLP